MEWPRNIKVLRKGQQNITIHMEWPRNIKILRKGQQNITIHMEWPRNIKILRKGQRNITIHKQKDAPQLDASPTAEFLPNMKQNC